MSTALDSSKYVRSSAVLTGVEEHPTGEPCEFGCDPDEAAALILAPAFGEKAEHMAKLSDDSGTQGLTAVSRLVLQDHGSSSEGAVVSSVRGRSVHGASRAERFAL
ncbi:MAG: hypothetical protein ACRDZ4_11170 [Egibacteraceae bacterium]